MTGTKLQTDVVLLACAFSAGSHAALVPEHLREGLGPGLGFAGSAAALAVVAVVLVRRPSAVALAAGAAVLAGLIVAYVLAATTGIPVLHPDVEPVDALALATKAVEATGIAAAVTAVAPRPRRAVSGGGLVPRPR